MFALVRKLTAIVLWLVFLVHGTLPALSAFVCVGMAGARLAHPCCPAPAQEEAQGPVWSSRCCHRSGARHTPRHRKRRATIQLARLRR